MGTGRFGPERSEMTINTALMVHDATAAITTPITAVRALSLDKPSRDVTTQLPFDPVPENNPLVGNDLITIDEDSTAPLIGGFFGLEPRRAPIGDTWVFHHDVEWANPTLKKQLF